MVVDDQPLHHLQRHHFHSGAVLLKRSQHRQALPGDFWGA